VSSILDWPAGASVIPTSRVRIPYRERALFTEYEPERRALRDGAFAASRAYYAIEGSIVHGKLGCGRVITYPFYSALGELLPLPAAPE